MCLRPPYPGIGPSPGPWAPGFSQGKTSTITLTSMYHASSLSSRHLDSHPGRYFEHFHPYLPVVRARDPDACYKRGPVLFWAVIMTACRRFARDDTAFQFLIDSLLP